MRPLQPQICARVAGDVFCQECLPLMAGECADSKIDEAVHLHGLHLVLSWRKESSVGFLMGSLRMQEEAKFGELPTCL